MGTWGTGPFDSDAAEDLVDRLEELSAAQRAEQLRAVFQRAVDSYDAELLAGEVLAAAAVIAANLPSGTSLPWKEEYPGISEWLMKPIPLDLSSLAIQALNASLPINGQFWRSWVDRGEREESEAVVTRLSAVLMRQ
jgi:Domain of unknown function (DUF4259)